MFPKGTKKDYCSRGWEVVPGVAVDLMGWMWKVDHVGNKKYPPGDMELMVLGERLLDRLPDRVELDDTGLYMEHMDINGFETRIDFVERLKDGYAGRLHHQRKQGK